jgi:hypothetical protein
MVQVALSLVAPVGAGLFIHGPRNAEAINVEFPMPWVFSWRFAWVFSCVKGVPESY